MNHPPTGATSGATPVIAMDLGGTKIRAGVVRGATVTHVRTVATPAASGARAVLDAVAALVARVARACSEEGTEIARLGIGAAGVIDPATGTVRSATDALPGWAGTELTDELTRRTGLPARAVNDVHAHCLGEASAGAARGTSDALFVAVGTGIGAGIIAGGRLVTGRHNVAGHVGHLPSGAAEGLLCPCGAAGHLEAVASGPAVLEGYRRGGGQAAASSTADLAQHAHGGDDAARAAFETAARALGSTLGGVVNLLSPEVVVLGGGLSGAGELWWPHVRENMTAELIPAVRGVPVRIGELGADAALVGAASLWSDNTSTERKIPWH